MRSFSASGSATTALWVHQELADHGSDSISSVLKLKRVEPPGEASKTPEGRRERKNEASNAVEVQGLGALVAEYNYVAGMSSSSFPIPKVVLCQQEASSKTSYEYVASTTVTLPDKPAA